MVLASPIHEPASHSPALHPCWATLPPYSEISSDAGLTAASLLWSSLDLALSAIQTLKGVQLHCFTKIMRSTNQADWYKNVCVLNLLNSMLLKRVLPEVTFLPNWGILQDEIPKTGVAEIGNNRAKANEFLQRVISTRENNVSAKTESPNIWTW